MSWRLRGEVRGLVGGDLMWYLRRFGFRTCLHMGEVQGVLGVGLELEVAGRGF